MDSQQSNSSVGVGARTPRVEAEMAAARRMMQDKRSDSERALDTAVERMLADGVGAAVPADGSAQGDAEEERAPLDVHVVNRSVVHGAAHRGH